MTNAIILVGFDFDYSSQKARAYKPILETLAKGTHGFYTLRPSKSGEENKIFIIIGCDSFEDLRGKRFITLRENLKRLARNYEAELSIWFYPQLKIFNKNWKY